MTRSVCALCKHLRMSTVEGLIPVEEMDSRAFKGMSQWAFVCVSKPAERIFDYLRGEYKDPDPVSCQSKNNHGQCTEFDPK